MWDKHRPFEYYPKIIIQSFYAKIFLETDLSTLRTQVQGLQNSNLQLVEEMQQVQIDYIVSSAPIGAWKCNFPASAL